MAKLSATKTDPVEIPGTNLWCVNVLVMAKEDRGNNVIQDQAISFLHNGVVVQTDSTNDKGMCEYTFNFPIVLAGNIFSEIVSITTEPVEDANVVNLVLTYRKPATISKRIDSLDPETEGDNGQYTTVVVLRDQDGKTVKGVRVWALMQDPAVGRLKIIGNEEILSDEHGTAFIQWPPFEEESRRFIIAAGGIVTSFTLEGPTRLLPPVRLSPTEKRAVATAASEERNFFKRLFLAFTAGYRQAKKKKICQENQAWQKKKGARS